MMTTRGAESRNEIRVLVCKGVMLWRDRRKSFVLKVNVTAVVVVYPKQISKRSRWIAVGIVYATLRIYKREITTEAEMAELNKEGNKQGELMVGTILKLTKNISFILNPCFFLKAQGDDMFDLSLKTREAKSLNSDVEQTEEEYMKLTSMLKKDLEHFTNKTARKTKECRELRRELQSVKVTYIF